MQTKKTPDASTECIQEILDKLLVWLELAKVPIKQTILPKTAKFESVNKAFNWIDDFANCEELEEIKRAYKLVPPETWKRYELWSIEGLQEQVILESAQKALLKRWKRNRPRLFGYVPKNPKH